MNTLKIFILTLPRFLTATAFVSLLFLVLKIAHLDNLPEIFPFAYEVGKITEALFMSYVASFIFYLVVVHSKETKDKIAFYPYALLLSRQIVQRVTYELQSMTRNISLDIDVNNVTVEQICSLANTLDVESRSNVMPKKPDAFRMDTDGKPYFEMMTWTEAQLSNRRVVFWKIEQIISSRMLIDTEWLEILMQIDYCGHMTFSASQIENQDCGIGAASLLQNDGKEYYDFYQLIIKLSHYIKLQEKLIVNK
jgi:hypothetical protein